MKVTRQTNNQTNRLGLQILHSAILVSPLYLSLAAVILPMVIEVGAKETAVEYDLPSYMLKGMYAQREPPRGKKCGVPSLVGPSRMSFSLEKVFIDIVPAERCEVIDEGDRRRRVRRLPIRVRQRANALHNAVRRNEDLPKKRNNERKRLGNLADLSTMSIDSLVTCVTSDTDRGARARQQSPPSFVGSAHSTGALAARSGG